MSTDAEQEQKKTKAKTEDLKRYRTKLLLWYTHDFKPLFTHKELEPIMEALGFVPLSLPHNQAITKFRNVDVVWKEYEYVGASATTTRIGPFRCRPHFVVKSPLPKPRLPYPRIDGLHLFTYKAFMDAVNFYLRRSYFSDLFHIWGLPIHPLHDKCLCWDYMHKNHLDMVYRLGTLDDGLLNLYSIDDVDYVAGKGFETIDDNIVDLPKIIMVSMDDIIVTDHQEENSCNAQDHEATGS